ncbi:RNA/RNP complex-1-interacting phosphatase isoform X2 [Chamaea fasciata]|uniref:RNA/RNP complex-1-interacting phosphatase isoform X2 n=1 Tax=Chamaea fasciata TaxID=190680 RepID=UPI00336A287D
MVGRGASRVPERWTDYIPLGCRMPGTRFIAFKVPLKKSFDQNLLPEERFSPHDLIRKVEERKEELGLIIDLTYTTRYYGREELPPTLRYSKILTMGHEIPNRKTILRFKYVVKRFLTHNKDNDKLIGVHCTHGLNRTGYLVCRYLIDVEGMEPNAAIELFNKSRGHPIERTNYIQDLQKRAMKNCELKNLGSDVFRKKGSAPAKPQKQLVKHHPSQAPLAVPRNPSSAKKKRRPDPMAQGQPQELGHRHGALGQRQLEQKKLEQKQLKKLEQKKLEQRQVKKLEQGQLEQRQFEKLEQRQQQQLEQKKLERRQQKKLERKQQKKLEQKQQKKLKHLEQNHVEQRQNHVEQRQLEKRNHLEQKQQRQQNDLEQRQPCSLAPRNCWLSPAPKKKHKELFPPQSPQAWLPQEPSLARKHRRRKHELTEQEMS